MIKRLWTGFWLTVLLAGIPIVLVYTVGNPLPARRDLATLLAEPLAEQNINAVIAVVAWLMRELLFSVSPWDVTAYATAIAVLIAAGGLACLLPARRALAANPIEALRAE